MIKKLRLILVLLLYLLITEVNSQTFTWIGRANLSIGFDYQAQDFNGENALYSPGGGFGLEGGFQVEILEGLEAYATAGYQLHVAFRSEDFDGVSNTTSFGFNRKFFTVGFNKFIPLEDRRSLEGLVFGFGVNYSFPGDLNRTENDFDLGTINYNPNLGFHIDAKVSINLSDDIYFEPGLRFRSLELFADTFTDGPINGLPADLRILNASGIELSLTVSGKVRRDN